MTTETEHEEAYNSFEEDTDDCFPKTDFDELRKRGEEQAKLEVVSITSGNPVELTPRLLENLSISAQVTKDYFNSKIGDFMTIELAKFVRILRKANFTWRSIAQEINDKLDGDWGSNQLMGIALCEAASKLLGEDANAEPWN